LWSGVERAVVALGEADDRGQARVVTIRGGVGARSRRHAAAERGLTVEPRVCGRRRRRPVRNRRVPRLRALDGELDRAGYTAAAHCLGDDLDALVVHLRYPIRHRRRWRSTNLLERSLGEVKRRTKIIGRFPGETTCLTLVWAVLDLYITHATNGIKVTRSSASGSSGPDTRATTTRLLRR
jgi:hypothetical protein